MVFLEVGRGIATVAQIVTNIQAHADTRIEHMGVIPYVCSVGIGGDVWPMQVDRIIKIVFLNLLVYIGEQLVVRNAYNCFNTYSFCIGKGVV